ncbi:MAG: hypothetical protein DRR16_22345 [Candidatus Parabeggiatoa sp. nov. 3]|nr:MAG: hypothetical protein DRR00_20375 [Gammaproteobacteria bacterium]RKZ63296.1 MAG: hypothetical protein DRQ99_17360 [Gammaproteobacteria bacterium]RKZ81323.1 MAG: hypothetical protein DRR16_22345 [Gammaproteobacteria bacterium]
MGKKNRKLTIPHTYKKPTWPDKNRASQIEHPNSDKEKLSWQIRTLDLDGPWGWGELDAEALIYIHGKLAQFECMTWAEIKHPNTGCHPIKITALCSEAQKRLTEIKVIEFEEELFSLRLSGKERIWGIRERHIFKILWWDPRHEVYPVSKKHT